MVIRVFFYDDIDVVFVFEVFDLFWGDDFVGEFVF